MTGAGTTTVAWTREPNFAEDPTDPTYVYPGRNVNVTDLSLERALQRSRLPDDNEAIESIATALDGALTVEYDLCHPWALTDAFVSDYTDTDGTLEWSMGRGQMPTSRWYIGVDAGSSVCERELKGAATVQYQVQISQQSPVRVTQTIVYADELTNTSLTPGDIVGGDESPYVFHGADLVIDASTKKKLQSGTLDITNNGSLDTGWNQVAVDAVAGDADYTLNVNKIATESISDNVSLVYGSTSATSPEDDIEHVDGDIEIVRGDGDTITFPLSGIGHNSLSWDNIPPSGDERVQEGIELYVNRVEATGNVSMADPFA